MSVLFQSSFYITYIIVITLQLNNEFCISIAFYGQSELRIWRNTNDSNTSASQWDTDRGVKSKTVQQVLLGTLLMNNSKSLIFKSNVQHKR